MTSRKIVRKIRAIFEPELSDKANYRELYDTILIGVQDARHEVYTHLHQAYSCHRLPTDFGSEMSPVKSVISYAIVFNHQEGDVAEPFSPKTWVEATYFFRILSDTINAEIRDTFGGVGTVIVPRDTPLYTRVDRDGEFLTSWSERHVAYSCGLGTFGLHHALITEKGCQVRLALLQAHRQICPMQDSRGFTIIVFIMCPGHVGSA